MRRVSSDNRCDIFTLERNTRYTRRRELENSREETTGVNKTRATFTSGETRFVPRAETNLETRRCFSETPRSGIIAFPWHESLLTPLAYGYAVIPVTEIMIELW